MATLTVRNLDEKTKQALRMRAAKHGSSMEEEARTILRVVVASGLSLEAIVNASNKEAKTNAWEGIRRLREQYGTFELELPERTALAGDRTAFE